MNTKLLLAGIVVLVLGIGAYTFVSKPKPMPPSENTGTPTTTQVPQSSPTETVVQTTKAPSPTETSAAKVAGYTLSDIKPHNSASDCWFAVNGSVYNVTSYIASQKHPGGEAILLGCGKDATDLFTNRPDGKGSHSDKAFSMLVRFKIGVLQ